MKITIDNRSSKPNSIVADEVAKLLQLIENDPMVIALIGFNGRVRFTGHFKYKDFKLEVAATETGYTVLALDLKEDEKFRMTYAKGERK